MNEGLVIRGATTADFGDVWAMLEPVIRTGESYSLPLDLSQEDGIAYWFAPGHEVFVAEVDDVLVGSYFIQANQRGGGSHVANCGYLTAAGSEGRGTGRAMCLHSLEYAKTQGYLAMQFNFVLSSNERAIRLWESLGFAIVGTLPGAYLHPVAGRVDVFVMYRAL